MKLISYVYTPSYKSYILENQVSSVAGKIQIWSDLSGLYIFEVFVSG